MLATYLQSLEPDGAQKPDVPSPGGSYQNGSDTISLASWQGLEKTSTSSPEPLDRASKWPIPEERGVISGSKFMLSPPKIFACLLNQQRTYMPNFNRIGRTVFSEIKIACSRAIYTIRGVAGATSPVLRDSLRSCQLRDGCRNIESVQCPKILS